jgi:SAM-dependent methyltransferase
MRWLLRLTKRALGRDFTNRGERVDIVYSSSINFAKLDIYQKSHYRRYQFASLRLGEQPVVGDIACGTGYGTVMLAAFSQSAVGYDISPIINIVRERYSHIPNVSFQQADILLLEANGTFDTIVSFETLEHFPPAQIPTILRKFNSMLKRDGKLIISTPYNQEETHASRVHHRSFYITESVLSGWLRSAEFALERLFYQNYLTHEIKEQLPTKDFMVAVCRK